MAGSPCLFILLLLISSQTLGSKLKPKKFYEPPTGSYKSNAWKDVFDSYDGGRDYNAYEYNNRWDDYDYDSEDFSSEKWDDDSDYDRWSEDSESEEHWMNNEEPWQGETRWDTLDNWQDDGYDSWEQKSWEDDSWEDDSWEDDSWEDDSLQDDWEGMDDARTAKKKLWDSWNTKEWDPKFDESWEGDDWKMNDKKFQEEWEQEEDDYDYSEEYYDDYDVSSFWVDDLEDKFETLLEANDYEGGVLGVVKNGRLVFARGYGRLGNRNLHSSTIMPISSLSKTLTAVAVLQLAQEGYLSLSDQVFGEDGILGDFSPPEKTAIDPRLYDITVEDLLRHAGGWDETVGPIYDPMMNRFYRQRGEDVLDISTALNLHGNVNQYNIIQFMMMQPLQFAPGTKYRYSNFGYSILGRVIEQVSDMPYEEYVKKEVLIPAGMMHTRIGPRIDDEEILWAGADDNLEINSQSLHKLVHPQLLDSTLGWYSNVHDLHRFAKCLLEDGMCNILHSETVRFMLEKPPVGNPWHEDTWRAIGLHATAEGTFWQDSDLNDNDIIFYHQAMPHSPYMNEGNVTLIALTTNNRYKRLRSSMEKYSEEVQDWPEDMRNVAIDELCMAELMESNDDVLVQFALSEHHMAAYMNALKLHGYYPEWIHGHTWLGITDFAVIAHRAVKPEDLDFKFFMSSDIRRFYNHVAEQEESGYQVALVQSYKSFSHDGMAAHFALLRRTAPLDNTALWQVNVPLSEYLEDLATFTKKGFSVQVQSVEQHGQEEYVSYVMTPSQRPNGDYLAYHSLSQDQLEFLVKSQSLEEYHLTYLDTYRHDKEPVFSAVFHKGAPVKWLLQTDVEEEDLADQAIIWHGQGYKPVVIVGYELQDHGLRYTGLWTKPSTSK